MRQKDIRIRFMLPFKQNKEKYHDEKPNVLSVVAPFRAIFKMAALLTNFSTIFR